MTEHQIPTIAACEVSLKVIRADGTVEDLGVVANYVHEDKKTLLEKLHDRIKKG